MLSPINITPMPLAAPLLAAGTQSTSIAALTGPVGSSSTQARGANSSRLLSRSSALFAGTAALLLSACFEDATGESSSTTGTDSTTTDTGTMTDTGMDTGSTDDGGTMDSPPMPLRPADGMTLPPTRAFLLWEDGMVPDDAMIESYRVCWTNQGLNSILNGCPVEQIQTQAYDVINDLVASADYFWKVQACYDADATDCSEFSDPVSFDTDNSLIGWWKLDDGLLDENTLSAVDSSPSGNTGTLQNFAVPAAWNTGNNNAQVGGALDFNGPNRYVDLGTAYNFNGTTPFSTEAWARRASVDESQTILAKIDPTSTSFRGYGFGFLASNEFSLALISDDAVLNKIEVMTTDTYNTPDSSYHLATTYDGTQLAAGIQLYVDSVEQNISVTTDDLSGPIQTTVSAAIGSIPDPVDNAIAYSALNGTIDDVMIYDRILSDEEMVNTFCAREAVFHLENGNMSALPPPCQ